MRLTVIDAPTGSVRQYSAGRDDVSASPAHIESMRKQSRAIAEGRFGLPEIKMQPVAGSENDRRARPVAVLLDKACQRRNAIAAAGVAVGIQHDDVITGDRRDRFRELCPPAANLNRAGGSLRFPIADVR